MAKIRKFNNNSLWWLDFSILNTNAINFFFSLESNIFFLKIIKKFYYFYYLINRKNLNNLLFSNLDCVFSNYVDFSKFFFSHQTFFCDFKYLLEVSTEKEMVPTYSANRVKESFMSTSTIFKGNTWSEREMREFNDILFINLIDSRKLLSNYNYNKDIRYNQFNYIIDDISV